MKEHVITMKKRLREFTEELSNEMVGVMVYHPDEPYNHGTIRRCWYDRTLDTFVGEIDFFHKSILHGGTVGNIIGLERLQFYHGPELTVLKQTNNNKDDDADYMSLGLLGYGQIACATYRPTENGLSVGCIRLGQLAAQSDEMAAFLRENGLFLKSADALILEGKVPYVEGTVSEETLRGVMRELYNYPIVKAIAENLLGRDLD